MKYALIIANTEYDDKNLSKLSAPGKDAEEFARVLKDENIGAFGDGVKIKINETDSVIREAIEDLFTQKKSDDLLLLYFSGHGIKDESGALYLAVKNTKQNRLRATSIQDYFITQAMDHSRSRKLVVILDCCNSGAFAQGTKAIAGGSMGTADAFRGNGYGRVVITASDSTQVAWEGEKILGQETKNSLFTHFLILGLEGEADKDYDGKITVNDLFEYASDQIANITPHQTPIKYTFKEKGQIILRERKRAYNDKYILFPVKLIENLESAVALDRERAVKQLAKLIKNTDIQLSNRAREVLEDIETNDDSTTVRQSAKQVLDSAFLAERSKIQEREKEHLKREEVEHKEKKQQEQLQQQESQKAREEIDSHAAPEFLKRYKNSTYTKEEKEYLNYKVIEHKQLSAEEEYTRAKQILQEAIKQEDEARVRALQQSNTTHLHSANSILIDSDVVHYETLGRGRPIIFLHSWIGSYYYWNASMQVTSNSFRSYALDLFGYGYSTHNPLLYTLASQANLINRFLEELGIGKVAIIGHGLGALVGLHFLAKHHETVDRMMLISCPLGNDDINSRMQTDSVAELLKWLSPHNSEGKNALSEALLVDPLAIHTSILEAQSSNIFSRTRNLGIPCLFVNGTNDPVISMPPQEWVDSFPAQFHQIGLNNVGHYPMIENPSQFNRLLIDFLALNSGESPREVRLKY